MRRSFRLGSVAALVGGLAALAGMPVAWASPTTSSTQVPLTASISGLGGSRSVALVTPDHIVADLGGEPAPVRMTIVVDEAGVAGDPGGWSVTAQASEFVDTAGDRVSAAALTDRDNQVSQSGGGGLASAVPSPGAMNQAETVFTDQGEAADRLYTGTFTGTSHLYLTPPNGTPAGTYTSTLTVTLLT